jgi:hypothetical protein
MSLYRQPGRVAGRTLALAAVAALAIGLAVGFVASRASKSEPTLATQMADLRQRLAPAREGIDLVGTEYGQAVRGGRVVAPTEYTAARDDLKRVQDALTHNRDDIRALSAARATALERAVAELARAVSQRATAAEVTSLSRAAGDALRAAVGP